MAFSLIFMMSTMFMCFVISIYFILLIIEKIGMTLLASKLKINKFALLWIPGIGALYDGKIMNHYLKYGKKFEIGYFTLITIVRISWLLFFILGPKYNDPSFDTYSSILSDICGVIILIDAVLKSITLKKSGYNIFISLIISIFLPSFWCFFANKKTEKI